MNIGVHYSFVHPLSTLFNVPLPEGYDYIHLHLCHLAFIFLFSPCYSITVFLSLFPFLPTLKGKNTLNLNFSYIFIDYIHLNLIFL